MTQAIDEARLNEFVGKMLGDIGGALSVPTVRIGFRLGLFDALARGPANSAELAARAGNLHERYVREWLLAQAANGYVDYDPPHRGRAAGRVAHVVQTVVHGH